MKTARSPCTRRLTLLGVAPQSARGPGKTGAAYHLHVQRNVTEIDTSGLGVCGDCLRAYCVRVSP